LAIRKFWQTILLVGPQVGGYNHFMPCAFPCIMELRNLLWWMWLMYPSNTILIMFHKSPNNFFIAFVLKTWLRKCWFIKGNFLTDWAVLCPNQNRWIQNWKGHIEITVPVSVIYKLAPVKCLINSLFKSATKVFQAGKFFCGNTRGQCYQHLRTFLQTFLENK
jgi:hypothetical protein